MAVVWGSTHFNSTENGIRVTCPKGSFDSEGFVAETIWENYQFLVTQSESKDQSPLPLRLRNILLSFTDYSEVPVSFQDNPEKFLEVMKKAHGLIQGRLFKEVNQNGGMRIENNKYSDTLDSPMHKLVQSYGEIFDGYFEEKQYKKAFKITQCFEHTLQGSSAYLKLAQRHASKQRYAKAAECLDALKCLPKDPKKLFADINKDHLLPAIKLMKQQDRKIQVLSAFVDTNPTEDVSTLVIEGLVITSPQDDLLKKIQAAIKEEDFDGAWKLIPELKSSEKRNNQRLSIIFHHIKKEDFNIAWKLIPALESSELRNNQRLSIIFHHIKKEDFDNALELIPALESSELRNNQYLTIIYGYVKKEDSKNAFKIIKKLGSSETRDNERIKILNTLIKQNKTKNIQELITAIESDKRKNAMYEKVLQRK